jgi:hypothetical protein
MHASATSWGSDWGSGRGRSEDRTRTRDKYPERRGDGGRSPSRESGGVTVPYRVPMPKWGFQKLPKHGPNPESRLYRTEGCACADLKDREKLSLGWDVLGGGLEELGYETVRTRTPWLDLVRCTRCGQYWYAATDTVDDDVYLQRLTVVEARDILERAAWPTYFDSLRHVGMDRFGGPE